MLKENTAALRLLLEQAQSLPEPGEFDITSIDNGDGTQTLQITAAGESKPYGLRLIGETQFTIVNDITSGTVSSIGSIDLSDEYAALDTVVCVGEYLDEYDASAPWYGRGIASSPVRQGVRCDIYYQHYRTQSGTLGSANSNYAIYSQLSTNGMLTIGARAYNSITHCVKAGRYRYRVYAFDLWN